MALISDFGFDHDAKLSSDQMIAHMFVLGLNVEKPWTKPRLLPHIERFHAQQRERLGTNSKEYLAKGFDPTSRDVTKAKLRQILSQYNIAYPAGQNADKPTLVHIFRENLGRLHAFNGATAAPPNAATRRSPRLHQFERNYRMTSADASAHNGSQQRRNTQLRPPPRAPSSQPPSSTGSSSRTSTVVTPEQLALRIENMCINAVRSVQAGDLWASVTIFESGIAMCSKAAAAEDERAELESREDMDTKAGQEQEVDVNNNHDRDYDYEEHEDYEHEDYERGTHSDAAEIYGDLMDFHRTDW